MSNLRWDNIKIRPYIFVGMAVGGGIEKNMVLEPKSAKTLVLHSHNPKYGPSWKNDCNNVVSIDDISDQQQIQ